MKVGDVMTKEVVSVDYGTKVKEVCKTMGDKRIGSVIVTQYGKPVGIFTERDLLSKVLLKGSLEDEVGKYMSNPLIVISPDYDVRESARIMADMKIRRLVVMEGGEIKGIFTAADLARIEMEMVCETCGKELKAQNEGKDWRYCYFCKKPVCFDDLHYMGILREGIYEKYTWK